MADLLRDRCAQFISKLHKDAILRQGSPADDLLEFVVSERGRAADANLDKSLPLCLYFATAEDRDDFVAAFREAKPGAIAKKVG